MASKESIDLGSAATVDTLPKNAAGRALNRRNLLTGLGVASAALGAELISRHFPSRPGVVEASNAIPSGFSEVDYLNFLLNIKYLQATFYSYITQGKDLPGTNPNGAPAITAVAATATTATVTVANTFAAGQTVIVQGLANAVPLGITALSATPTTATVSVPNTYAAGQSVIISGLTNSSPISITGISSTSSTVTVAVPNTYAVGQRVTISGLTGASANITNVTATNATVTVAAVNSFVAGQTGVVIAGLTGSLAGYNGTFTIATANATGFTFSLVSLGIASTAVGAGSATATIPMAQYNGTFTIATATTSAFTFAFASAVPILISTAVPAGTGVTTISLAQYNGTYTIATATAAAFTFAFTTAVPITAAAVPTGTGVSTIPLAKYNGIYTIATATAAAFTFAFVTAVPVVAAAVPAGTAVAAAPNPPYAVNGAVNYPATGTNPLYNPLSAAPVFSTFTNGAQITNMLNEIYYDELNQVINLQNLINGQVPTAVTGSGAIIRPPMDILGTNKATTTQVTLTPQKALAQARLLEDLSVTAFAGVAQYLTGANLTAATQILAVDGLHAGALRLTIIQWNAANTLANAVIDLVGDSDIVPVQPGVFWQVQADDVAPVDQGTAALAAAGPQVVTTPVKSAATQNVIDPCTSPIAPFTVGGTSYTSCTPTQYQGFFATAGAATGNGTTPAGFAFARTPSQVLSVLYAPTPGATPQAPALPSPSTNPLGASNNLFQGGFFPTSAGGNITVIVS